MRTYLLCFVLFSVAAVFCFFAPELAPGSVPPQGDNVAPIELQHDNRRYARSLANVDVGEPRTVRLIYFLPNDQDFRPEVMQRMKDEIRRIQIFYREQMQAHGHGAKTFGVETDAQGEPLVHRVDGQHHNGYYQTRDIADNTLTEVGELFDVNVNIHMIVIDNHRERIGPLLGVQGYGLKYNKIAGYTLLPGEFTFEVAAHELGHAFGLQHDFHDDAYMMSYGEGPDELSACSANFLSVHPYFNHDIPLDQDSRPTLELISPLEYPKGEESVSVQFRVNDPDGLHKALLFTTTRRPHGAEGFPEVLSCLHFAGERTAVVEFDYDGVLPSIDFGNLSEWTTHPISVVVVDRHGNVAGEPLRLFETKPGRIATIRTPSFNPNSLALSQDGALIAASGLAVSESNAYSPQVRLWERATGANIAMIDQAASVALSPDGMTLAYGSWTGLITLWDVKTQQVIVRLRGHTVWSNALAFSPDGRTLASGSYDTTVKLWDVASQSMIATLDGHRDIVNSVAFSFDGRTLASGSEDTTIKLWDIVTRIEVATLEGHANQVSSVAFSPDGSTLASGLADGSVVSWDLETGTSIARYAMDFGRVNSVAYSPAGILAADGGWNKTVTLWDATTGAVLDSLFYTEPVDSVAISPNGSVLATCTSRDRSGTIEIWNLAALSASSDEIVQDDRLRTAIRISLDKPAGAPIGLEELAMLKDLSALRASIYSLAGLEFASNLRILYVDYNNISNLAPLAGLTDLGALGASQNNISDLAPLAVLTNLTNLELDYNNISDIRPLRGLTNLTLLSLSNNNFSDISPLSVLIDLEHLYLAGNKVWDTSVLSGLTNLTTLHLAVNSISDISPLIANSGLGDGDTLFLRRNPLNYEAVNSHIPLLKDRGVTVSFIDRTPTTLRTISGEEQQGVPSAPLLDPFVVEVRDEHGDVFEGVPVTFGVPSGGEMLSVSETTTDADGRAESILTLGQRTGTITVTVSSPEIAERVTFMVVSEATPPRDWADVNGDGAVTIQDLVLVAFGFGDEALGAAADVNRDGVVNIQDLVLVAAAFGNAGAAPSARPQILGQLSAADVQQWLGEARTLEIHDATVQQGILALEQLLAALTPNETVLLPNYPNPFNPETWMPYHLAQGTAVEIAIYDAKGALVRRLALGYQTPGYYADRGRAAYWDGRNESGETVASGVYLYQLRAGDYAASRRMVIIK